MSNLQKRKIISLPNIQKISYSLFCFCFACIWAKRSTFQNICRKLSVQRIRSYFRGKETSSLIIQKKSYPSTSFFGKTIFSEHLQKIVRPKNKIIFSGKRNIFLHSTNSHIPVQFFWKDDLFRIFEKQNMAFGAVNGLMCENEWIISSRLFPTFLFGSVWS